MTTDRFVTSTARGRVAGVGFFGVAAAMVAGPLAQAAAAVPTAAGPTTGIDSEAGSSPQEVSEDVTPDYGYQKVRVGVRIASGAYVPAGTTTAGSVLTITETGPDESGGPATQTCTTASSTVAAGSSATYCVFENGNSDSNYSALPGDTVTVTQNSANPGLVLSTESATVGPCVAGPDGLGCPSDANAVLTDSGVAPRAADDHLKVVDGSSVKVNVLGNDQTAGATPSLKVASPPAHGRASVDASGTKPRIRYTPKVGFSGHDHFAYQLRTANGAAVAIVTITVTAGAPKAKNDHAKTTEDHAVTIHVLANDHAYGGGALHLSGVGKAHHGTVTRHKRYVVYSPSPGFVGQDRFTYKIRTRGGTDTATVQVQV
jgi:Bacterial Ig domain